jgi:broad specificity phosphatase PhoE
VHLYFIRHGQSYINLKDIDWSAMTDVDTALTDLGQRQAALLAAWLPSHVPEIDLLYASTMRRAQETAITVASAYNGIEIRPDDRLREIGNNRFDHSPWTPETFPVRYADYWASARPFSPLILDQEGAETFMHFRTRIGLFIEEIAELHPRQTVVVVCHGGVVECAFDHIFNIGPWRRCEVWAHNTALTHFEFVEHPGREVWRLHYHNRIEHLQPLLDERKA